MRTPLPEPTSVFKWRRGGSNGLAGCIALICFSGLYLSVNNLTIRIFMRIICRLKSFLVFSCLAVLLFSTQSFATSRDVAEKQDNYRAVQKYLAEGISAKQVLTPEGRFVTVFNPKVEGWLQRKWTREDIKKIRKDLANSLHIPLTKQGFAQAADRATGKGKKGHDDTNYDAVWVRDSMWIYQALRNNRPKDARRILLAIWDYYASPAQLARFDDCIAYPGHALNQMAVPHIRFNGASPTFADVMMNGKPQVWNHRQNDAHGLFLLSLADAIQSGQVTKNDISVPRVRALARFFAFFAAIDFSKYEDAGAWEEIPRRNTSSIGLVTNAMQVWKALLYEKESNTGDREFADQFFDQLSRMDSSLNNAWSEESLSTMAAQGLATVKRQLALGGESPDYPPDDVHFRRADAALLTLFIPRPLDGLSEAELRHALTIVETLIRPAGVLRYKNDSYQSGNYWISSPDETPHSGNVTATGDTSSREAFLSRLSGLIPNSEAQWFFDSQIALVRLQLAQRTIDPVRKREDVFLATVHLKRALGQLTGRPDASSPITADGKPVQVMLPPESINTVILNGRRELLPSPITPLNWARAALIMALDQFQTSGGEQ